MPKVLVIADRVGRSIDDSVFEMATAARNAGAGSVSVVLLGHDLVTHASVLAAWFDEVILIDDPRLAVPDGDAWTAVLAPVLKHEAAGCVMAAHTNQGLDYVPALAVRLDVPLITDALSVDLSGDSVTAVRPEHGGKVHARVSVPGPATGCIVTLRPGANRVGDCPQVDGNVRHASVPTDFTPRRRFVETVAGDVSEVDITQAERLVAVGRGIEDEDSLDLIRELATALGAEVACSRPVVDKQWLPKSRQVGTSGKTVKPKLYVAVGISGSFQHMGGLKGDPFVVAINKDGKAPIFQVADVGVVGDLYEIVPLLSEKIQSVKG